MGQYEIPIALQPQSQTFSEWGMGQKPGRQADEFGLPLCFAVFSYSLWNPHSAGTRPVWLRLSEGSPSFRQTPIIKAFPSSGRFHSPLMEHLPFLQKMGIKIPYI
ncbi:MAG: hypothetical protein HFG75_13075 [Hungatella sp.]|nr:hypothetical protein [Hungatella sp.]